MINTGMSEDDKTKKVESPKNGDKAMFRATGHLIIKDKETNKVIVNKRG
jgi:hypothetical protein